MFLLSVPLLVTICPGGPIENLKKKVKVILLRQQTTISVSKQNLSCDGYWEEDRAENWTPGCSLESRTPWQLLKAVPTAEELVPSGLLKPSARRINVNWAELGPIPPLTSKQASFCRYWGPAHTSCVDSHVSYLKKPHLKLLRFIS